MKEPDTETLKEEYPSVELAYPLAIGSYEIAQKRWESMDNKLQTLITFVVTTTLAIPVLTKDTNLNFRSGWFIAAVAVFGLAVIVGLYARFSGYLIAIDPSILYESYLNATEWEFKKDFIYYAGHNFKANTAQINLKGNLANAVVALFFIGAVLVSVWVGRGQP